MFKYQNNGLIICLTGVMYSGKTTILKQAYKLKKDKLPPDNVKFIDFLKKWDEPEEEYGMVQRKHVLKG